MAAHRKPGTHPPHDADTNRGETVRDANAAGTGRRNHPADAHRPGHGRLYLVATPIGNLEDITRRAVRVLREADTVLAEDTRHTRKLLSHLDIRVPLRACHEHNEHRVAVAIVENLRRGATIALVSDAGTPAVSDPGFRLVRAAIDAGIDVVPVPGPSAALAALIASGLPTDRFTFLGYPPRRTGELERFFEALAATPGTLVMLESPRRVGATLQAAAAALGVSRRACIARELTKAHEEFLRGELGELAVAVAEPLRGEVTLVIEGAGAAAPTPVDGPELRRRYARLLAAGSSPRAALRELVEATGTHRREIYRALHLDTDPDLDPNRDAEPTPGDVP